MVKNDGVKLILKKPSVPTNKLSLGSKIKIIEGNLRMPIYGANRDITAVTSEVEHVASRMSHPNDGLVNDTENVRVTTSENPYSGLNEDRAGNDASSVKKDVDEEVQNAWLTQTFFQ
uniref:Uncharacterized protein n=1 Tax=Tanacetum cinerariifolium TaxID=118510 RepID=A0A6L2JL27_TANCI|nr:hypothetical protein [Tanacetum cinerariifolium]